MKRNVLKSFILGLMIVSLTGCVKFNANMDIKKDKSMDFSIIYAVDTTYFGDDMELLDDANKKQLEESGFNVSDYSEDKMKGFKLVRSIKNIDTVSSTSDEEYSLSGVLEEDSDDKMFKVKKGFLKNTYSAKLDFNASDSELNNSSSLDDTDDYDMDSYTDEEYMEDDTEEENIDDSTDTDMDFSQFSESMASNMDLSFNVTLPYSSKSNNATKTSNDNKSLSWSLTSDKAETIEFEFELYNMTNIYILIGGAVALLIIIILIIVGSKKKKKKSQPTPNNIVNDTTSNVQTPAQEQTTPVETPQAPQQEVSLEPQVNSNIVLPPQSENVVTQPEVQAPQVQETLQQPQATQQQNINVQQNESVPEAPEQPVVFEQNITQEEQTFNNVQAPQEEVIVEEPQVIQQVQEPIVNNVFQNNQNENINQQPVVNNNVETLEQPMTGQQSINNQSNNTNNNL